MSKILISYRRKDSEDVTGRIYDRLSREFDPGSVFMDVDSIPLGVNFRKHLDAQVAQCHVFLAVIGPEWMEEEKGSKWKSRLEDPKDFVRIEIEAALKRDIPVIPVLVRGASIPAAEMLPASMQDLCYRNGIAVRAGQDFHRDMDRLIEYLKQQILGISQQQTSQTTTERETSRQARLVSATVEWKRKNEPDPTPRRWVVYIDNDSDAPITVEEVKVSSPSREPLTLEDWGPVRPKVPSDYELDESQFDPSGDRPEVYVRFLDSYGQRWTLRKGVLKRVGRTR